MPSSGELMPQLTMSSKPIPGWPVSRTERHVELDRAAPLRALFDLDLNEEGHEVAAREVAALQRLDDPVDLLMCGCRTRTGAAAETGRVVVGERPGSDEVEVDVSTVQASVAQDPAGAARAGGLQLTLARRGFETSWLSHRPVCRHSSGPSTEPSAVGCADGSAVLRSAPSAQAVNELPCPSASANRTTNETNEASPRRLPRLRRLDLVPIPYLPNWCGALHLTYRPGPRPTAGTVVHCRDRSSLDRGTASGEWPELSASEGVGRSGGTRLLDASPRLSGSLVLVPIPTPVVGLPCASMALVRTPTPYGVDRGPPSRRYLPHPGDTIGLMARAPFGLNVLVRSEESDCE